MSFESGTDMGRQQPGEQSPDEGLLFRVTPASQDGERAYHEASTRSAMYQFLASVYLHPPTEKMLACLKDADFIAELMEVFGPQTMTALTDCASRLDPVHDLPQLKQEYMDLYVVPAGRYVTPFEDVYRGVRQDGQQEGGLILGERAIAAKIMYRSAGALMDQQCRELPNHIGVELSFMAFLCEREAVTHQDPEDTLLADDLPDDIETTDIYRQYQLLFLQEHLNDWFPQLNLSIQKKAKTSFYRGLAQLTEDFITWDMMSLLPSSAQRQ